MIDLDYVQRFIEDNIDTIDAEDWQGMYMFWYQNQVNIADCHPWELKELNHILTSALGVHYETLYLSAEQALSEYLRDIVENDVAKLRRHELLPRMIHYTAIVTQLKSNLLFNIEELYALTARVVTQLGYDSTPSDFTVR